MVINSTADLSIEDIEYLMNETDVVYIKIKDKDHYPIGHTYDISTMYTIKQIIGEFFKGCPERDLNNPNSEKEIAAYIYVKLAHLIEEDQVVNDVLRADKNFRNYASDYIRDARGISNALIGGFAHDFGFAETLRNLFAEAGIVSTYVEATPILDERGRRGPRHAWNMVWLDGQLYNCDLLRDREFILREGRAPKFLTSNLDSGNFEIYILNHLSPIVKAGPSFPEDEKTKLISKYRLQIQQEISQAQKQAKKKPGFFKRIKNRLIKEDSQPGNYE